MRRKNELFLYGVTALLLLGAGSLWWQGVRPIPREEALGELLPAYEIAEVGEDESPEAQVARIFVHVAGAVVSPGVYEMREGQRVYEALDLAVPADDADLAALNLAGLLRDSQKVYVPKQGEGESQRPDASDPSAWTADRATPFPINVNNATRRELEQLPGIGPVLATAIIARREEIGYFARPEDLMSVSGIGPKTFEKLAPLVIVD